MYSLFEVKLKCQLGNLLILNLRELVLECRQELRIHLHYETSHIVYDHLQLGIEHTRRLLHFFVPERANFL